jgi:hypothetical protein
VSYYRYMRGRLELSPPANACSDCRYFDIHASPVTDPDYAAAARAVACLELVKLRTLCAPLHLVIERHHLPVPVHGRDISRLFTEILPRMCAQERRWI